MGRKLGALKPARFPEIAAQERRLWEAIGSVWQAAGEYIWKAARFKGSFDAAERFEFTPELSDALVRAGRHIEDSILGHARDPEAFTRPSNAEIDVNTPIYKGKPLLPGELRTALTTGLDRATREIGDDAARLLGPRLEEAREQLFRRAFERLSDGARVKIGDILTAEDLQGGSIRDLLLRAMENGENPLKVARDLRAKFANVQNYQWARLSRTEIAFGQNFAMERQYGEAGYVLPRNAGGENIATPPFHPNCFPAGTVVQAPGLCAALRMWYSGDLCEIVLADGSELSATVNHPLLTPRGFVGAGDLRVGDDVIQSLCFQRVLLGDPNVEWFPAAIEDVFVALGEAHGMSTSRVPLAAEDVHGDAQFGNGYVDIVAPNGFLQHDFIACRPEHISGDMLGAARAHAFDFAGSSDLTAMFLRLALTADCRMSRPNHPLSRFRSHVIGSELLRFAPGADANAVFDQPISHGSAIRSERLSEALDAFAGEVAACKVVHVRRVPFAGHVYDLQTLGSLYIANTVLSSNCVCGLTIDPDSGYMLLDVSPTACHICQAHLAEQRILTGGIGRMPVDQPVRAVQPEPPPRVQARLPRRKAAQ